MKITPEIEAVARAFIDHRLSITAGDALRWEELDEYEKVEIFGYAIAAIRALRWPTARQIEDGEYEYSNVGVLPYAYTAMINRALGENK